MTLSGHEIRNQFIQFFKDKGHAHLPSSSLVPKKDPTVLLTTAGMLQFKPIFMGLEKPASTRAVTVQKCFRTTDLDNVGRTARHHTFFEMLGNFSFGDYFKEEVIPWAWEFLTGVLGLPKDQLWVSVFTTDHEAARIWQEKVGVSADRIVYLGEDSNFWAAGPTGPCGPCSEIYIDLGVARGCGSESCAVGCDCDRFLEIWNLVFMEFNRDESGQLTPLPAKNIDTGMGLERIASVLQGVPSNYETDLLKPLLDAAAQMAGITYGQGGDTDVSLKLIADHVRGTTFLIGDGVVPSNEGRGYVLRRIMRRAIRHGKRIGIQRAFLAELGALVIEQYAGYPELPAQREFIAQVMTEEERRFNQTIDRGQQLLSQAIATLSPSAADRVLAGETAFELYDTYGFPLELTIELCAEEGVRVDDTGFHAAMEAQRERARSAREAAGVTFASAELATKVATPFTGYEGTEEEATVVEVFQDKTGRYGVVLDTTPFYAESGGQVGDVGMIGSARVADTQKQGEIIIHLLAEGEEAPAVGAKVRAIVDGARRLDTMRHHTATHLLHAALKQVLGPNVNQAGSLVGPTELRFDFTFPRPLTPEELREVEDLVNARILENHAVSHLQMSMAEAQESGAMALFGEKYGDTVRVIDVPGFSKELCGGTHVHATGTIGLFKVLREEGIAAGIRRITAVSGLAALGLLRKQADVLAEAGQLLKASTEELPERVERLQAKLKAEENEVATLRARLAVSATESLLAKAQVVAGTALIAEVAMGLSAGDLKSAVEHLRDKLASDNPAGGVVVLGSVEDGKVAVVAAATDAAVKAGANAGKLIQAVTAALGGKGGGKPQLAQGGGGDASKLQDAIAAVPATLEAQLPVKA